MRVLNVRTTLLNAFAALLLLSFSILPITTNAHTLPVPSGCAIDDAWFIGFGGGASWISLSGSTSVKNGSTFPPPFNQDRFTINNPSTGIVQLNVGYITNSLTTYFTSLSAYIQYRHYYGTNITGSIDQYSLPEFHNYNYSMSFEADLFTLNGKVGLVQISKIIPYLSGGIGFVNNHLNNYSETALPNVTPRISPAYQGNTHTNFALTLGAGFDLLVNRCTTLTLGYDHVFQGNIISGSGVTTWSGTKLNFGNANLDTVFVNMTLNFPQT